MPEHKSLTNHKNHPESCCHGCVYQMSNCNERGTKVVQPAKKKRKNEWNYKILNCTDKEGK